MQGISSNWAGQKQQHAPGWAQALWPQPRCGRDASNYPEDQRRCSRRKTLLAETVSVVTFGPHAVLQRKVNYKAPLLCAHSRVHLTNNIVNSRRLFGLRDVQSSCCHLTKISHSDWDWDVRDGILVTTHIHSNLYNYNYFEPKILKIIMQAQFVLFWDNKNNASISWQKPS